MYQLQKRNIVRIRYLMPMANAVMMQLKAVFNKAIEIFTADYKVESNDSDSNILIMAIHGGKIEPATTELARLLSHKYSYKYYSFLGTKRNSNSALHVTSTEFREPKALELVSKSTVTISLHGCSGLDEFTYVGGRDIELGSKITKTLKRHNFSVEKPSAGLGGTSILNICNKNISGKGVQLEISRGLRNSFLRNKKTMENYALAIYEALSED
jgi:phage replication-related protein YjqB (UPF0714/DUF867 family)